jgi:tyrosyl-DNA phosphodiesterase 2
MFTGLRTQLLSWWHETALPELRGVDACFQTWNHHDDGNWLASSSQNSTLRESSLADSPHDLTILNLVTWNVDSGAPSAGPRMRALLDAIESQTNADVIFLQEVNRTALAQLIEHPWIKRSWYCSDVDGMYFGKQAFITVTLL